MNIGIIGSGEMGRTLGQLWSKAGHDILFGSRNPQRVAEWIDEVNINARYGTYLQAADHGDVVLLSTIWSDTESAVKAAGSFDGKILIDCTNPEGKDGLVLGHTTSGAEEISGWIHGGSIVKAFNHIYGSMLRIGPQFEGDTVTIFYCGDDNESKKIAASLAGEIGLDAVDAGELKVARYLEPLSALYVHLVSAMNWSGDNIGLKFLRR
jgi:predicted dinucleotide-binding enzyme